MSANIDVTIIAIVENKSLFFKMIDYADQSGEGDEGLSIHLYNKELSKIVISYDKENDQKALYNKLSLANLNRCGLSDLDDRAGRFYLQPWLISMIRQIEKIRIKYLSSAELDGLRRDLIGLNHRAITTEFAWINGDDDYEEFRDHVYATIRRVYTNIKDNISSLQGRAIYLSSVLKSQDLNKMDHYDQQDETLKMVRKIYDRNVIPTLQFLDERYLVRSHSSDLEPSKKEMTAISAIQAIIDTFSDHGLIDQAMRLQTLKTKLLRNAEIISDVRISLEQYTLLERGMRQFYDKVEARRHLLRNAIEEKRNGRKKGSIITRRPDLFSASLCMSGLKRRNSINNPIDLAIHNGRVFLEEHIRISSSRTDPFETTEFLPVREINRASREHHIAMHQLKKLTDKMSPIDPDTDIILYLHKYLSKNWRNYKLGYIWEAIPLIEDSKKDKIVASTVRKIITHDQYQLAYYPRYIQYGAKL
ncbi:MAG: hypothetical protein RPT25_09480 [Cycloclasticus sp.]